MGLPPDAPLPGKTPRRFIRSGAPWLAATRAVDSALSQFGRQTRTKPRKSYQPAFASRASKKDIPRVFNKIASSGIDTRN